MQRKLIAAANTAGLLLFCGAASAEASAKITFGDPPSQTIDMVSSGAYADGQLASVMLSPFGSASVDLDYTVELSADGLPAARDWTYCSPTVPVHYCGPAPTGSELAAAAIFLAFAPEAGMEGITRFTGSDPAIFNLSSGTATYHGTMSFTVTDTQGDEPRWVYVFLEGAVFVDAAPVPEPATLGLLLAGLATIARMRRRASGTRASPGAARFDGLAGEPGPG